MAINYAIWTESELSELLEFISISGGVYTYPNGNENHKCVYLGCLALEKRGLVRRSVDEQDCVFFAERKECNES